MSNINFRQINPNMTTVKRVNDANIKSIGFDMYDLNLSFTDGTYVTLKVFCKKNTFPEFKGIGEFQCNLLKDMFIKYLSEKRIDYNGVVNNGYFYYGNNGLEEFNRKSSRIMNYVKVSARSKNDKTRSVVQTDNRLDKLGPSKYNVGYSRPGNNTRSTTQTSRAIGNNNMYPNVKQTSDSNQRNNVKAQALQSTVNTGKKADSKVQNNGNNVLSNYSSRKSGFRNSKVVPQLAPLQSKTYCMADMHGEKNAYDEAMKQILPKDRVYILGDAIDRGEHGLDILEDIIKRQKDPEHNPQITFLLGNHEVGLLDLRRIKKEFNLSMQDIATLKKYDRINCDMFFWNSNKTLYKKKIEEAIREMKDEDIENNVKSIKEKMKARIFYNLVRSGEKGKNVEDELKEYMKRIRAYRENGTIDTLEKLEKLDSQKQNQILNFLYDSNIAVSVEEKGKKYLMIHAAPLWDDNQNQPQQNNVWNQLKEKGKIEYKETGINDTWNMVGQRDLAQKGYDFANKKGYYMTICGHTPSDDGEIERGTNYIRIDGGCGHKDRKNPNLVLYNLTDDKEIYIPPYSIIKGQTHS